MITEIFEKQDLTRIQARTKVKYLLNFVAHDGHGHVCGRRVSLSTNLAFTLGRVV